GQVQWLVIPQDYRDPYCLVVSQGALVGLASSGLQSLAVHWQSLTWALTWEQLSAHTKILAWDPGVGD
ncbi:MAG: hypothetical protein Q6K99_11685, partial [Thermostichales cyanobacterium BF4_bins_65]